MIRLAALISLLHLLAACGGGSDDGNLQDAGQNQADASPPLDTPQGRIAVSSVPSASVISLGGTFNDGPPIEPRVEMSRAGACRWMKYTPTFCDPACDGTAMCVDGTCQPFPARIDKGALEWTWPGGSASVTPDGTLFYGATGDVSQHGETSLAVSGETLNIETLEAPEPANDWAQEIENRSGDAVLRWSNPIGESRVRLTMTDCVGSHGGIGETELECEAPDTGELRVSDEFLVALEAGDWSRGECGSHQLIRYTHTDSADGSFRFEAESRSNFFYFPR